jgi:hypothetical protein
MGADMKTPSEALTEIILPSLVKEKLFLAEDAEKSQAKFAKGLMRAEDWLLAVENTTPKEAAK